MEGFENNGAAAALAFQDDDKATESPVSADLSSPVPKHTEAHARASLLRKPNSARWSCQSLLELGS